MSRNRTPMPPELQGAVGQRPPSEQQRLEHLWELLGDAEPSRPVAPTTDDAWALLEHRLEDADAPAASPLQPETPAQAMAPARLRRAADRAPARSVRRVLVAGGAVAVVLVAAFVLWWMGPVLLQTPPGAQAELQLPDGTRVELNSDTRLAHARSYGAWPLFAPDERVVRLEGEAYFDVVHDGRPFIVETFNARIEVLGTRFNVRARPAADGGETAVTLESGRVRVVAPARGGSSALLEEAGATAVVDTGAVRPQRLPSARLERALAWRRQGFFAVDQPLEAILDEVERRFAVEIETEGALTLTDSMSVFYLEDASAEQILHDLCLAQACSFRRSSRGYVIFARAGDVSLE